MNPPRICQRVCTSIPLCCIAVSAALFSVASAQTTSASKTVTSQANQINPQSHQSGNLFQSSTIKKLVPAEQQALTELTPAQRQAISSLTWSQKKALSDLIQLDADMQANFKLDQNGQFSETAGDSFAPKSFGNFPSADASKASVFNQQKFEQGFADMANKFEQKLTPEQRNGGYFELTPEQQREGYFK